jgi:hypothetical protein
MSTDFARLREVIVIEGVKVKREDNEEDEEDENEE